MSSKSGWVYSRTQGFVPIVVVDGQMYYGYYIHCLYPAMGDTRTKGVVIPYVLSTAFVGLDHYMALYLH